MVVCILGVAGCATTGDTTAEAPPVETPISSAPSDSASEETATFMASLKDIGSTEWTGLDDTYNDRVTFIFAADGSLSYRTAEGTFSDPADTWSVDSDILVFQASFGGRYGVATHSAVYDASTGELTVEYTTTTNRQSTYTLRQVD